MVMPQAAGGLERMLFGELGKNARKAFIDALAAGI